MVWMEDVSYQGGETGAAQPPLRQAQGPWAESKSNRSSACGRSLNAESAEHAEEKTTLRVLRVYLFGLACGSVEKSRPRIEAEPHRHPLARVGSDNGSSSALQRSALN